MKEIILETKIHKNRLMVQHSKLQSGIIYHIVERVDQRVDYIRNERNLDNMDEGLTLSKECVPKIEAELDVWSRKLDTRNSGTVCTDRELSGQR